MEAVRNAILGAGALLCLAALIWLGFGGPSGRLAKRASFVGVALLPVAVYTAWLATGAPGAPRTGGFLSPWALGLMMLSPGLLVWFAACFLVGAIGHTLRLPDRRTSDG